jgi:1-acyl-sn-glycerol-3-phosphate acyltransferase
MSALLQLKNRLRGFARLIGFAVISTSAFIEFLWLKGQGQLGTPRARALWLQRFARKLVRLLRVRAVYHGQASATGVLVFNHLSYLDIVLLAARDPVIFVAKKEVRSWPVIGWAAACAGTIFVDRTRRTDVTRVAALIRRTVGQGVRVCLFPEGTSSDGHTVLPFRTSLLEPIAAQGWPITAGSLSYRLEDGIAAEEVCYWGDMRFAQHFPRLLSKKCIHASVAYYPVNSVGSSRKELGRELHRIVSRLATEVTA